MAVKKGGMPPRKPLVENKVADSDDEVIVRPRSQTVTMPSAAELRAEREPAVIIQRSKPTAWQRAKAWVVARTNRHEEMADHLATVKAGVMHELETMGMKRGIAVSSRPFGSPFASVLLPAQKPKRPWMLWGLLAVVALVFVGIIVWFGRSGDSANAALVDVLVAVREHDVKTFEDKVDVASVATSVVNQMFNVPQEAGNPLAARMTAYVKPGLAEGLRDDMLAAVDGAKGSAAEGTLLGKIWGDLGGEKVRVGAPSVAMQDDRMAVAELPLVRKDLGLTLPLQVVLTKAADGSGWQVVDIPNLAAVLDGVMVAEKTLESRRKESGMPAIAEGVRVLNVKKLKDVRLASNLIVSMEVLNSSPEDVKDVQLELAFGDAAGQPMMTSRVTLEGDLPAGARREQVWNVPVDRSQAAERYVADLPLSALSVTVTVVK